MKICFMCDLHLPFEKKAIQYNVLEWAVADVTQNQPDCIVFAGDVTCDGNENVYDYFVRVMTDTGIPFFYIPGNSDLRDNKSCESIRQKASACKNMVNGLLLLAVNDCDGVITDEQLEALEYADDNSIVFMHHPLNSHKEEVYAKLLNWRERHPNTMLFYGHLHYSDHRKNAVSLQALDPDKSIGESPCITYYDTETKELRPAYYDAPVPMDIYDYLGISCYNPVEQIRFAIDNNLRCIELRPNCIDFCDQKELQEYIVRWRSVGGENLAIHLPDIRWSNGSVERNEKYDKLIEMVNILKADRVTQHVPVVSVAEVKNNPEILPAIAAYLTGKLNPVSHDIVIGVENMHMTAKEQADDSRRFGYLPEECLEFMNQLAAGSRHKVGINFDIGHARNNMPYSQKYQIGTWLAMLGKYIVGYHIHQVTYENGVFENHMPITDVYGRLISYASLFKYWSLERINKAPFIFEMRPEKAYEITLKTFEKHRNCV